MLAGLGGFDGGVHRQQVRLGCQIIHRGDDLADGLALLAQPQHACFDGLHLLADLAHAGHRLLSGLAPALSILRRPLRVVEDGPRFLAGQQRCLPHFFNSGGRLAHRGQNFLRGLD